MEVYDVFGQPRRGEPFLHCGSLLAGDPEGARLLALQLFCRRREYVRLWVVPRRQILTAGEGDGAWLQPATDKTYRLGEGFARTRVLWQRFGRRPQHDRGDPAEAGPAARPVRVRRGPRHQGRPDAGPAGGARPARPNPPAGEGEHDGQA